MSKTTTTTTTTTKSGKNKKYFRSSPEFKKPENKDSVYFDPELVIEPEPTEKYCGTVQIKPNLFASGRISGGLGSSSATKGAYSRRTRRRIKISYRSKLSEIIGEYAVYQSLRTSAGFLSSPPNFYLREIYTPWKPMSNLEIERKYHTIEEAQNAALKFLKRSLRLFCADLGGIVHEFSKSGFLTS